MTHYVKKGIRALGIAESYQKGQAQSVLAGVVVRRDLILDGIVYGKATIEGDDATESIISMFQALKRNDINCIILDGLIISMYNIIGAEAISERTGKPVIAVTFNESSGIEEAIKMRFDDWEWRLKKYQNLGERERISLKTKHDVFARWWKIERPEVIQVLDSFTLQGSIPEPIRIAKLAARAFSHALK